MTAGILQSRPLPPFFVEPLSVIYAVFSGNHSMPDTTAAFTAISLIASFADNRRLRSAYRAHPVLRMFDIMQDTVIAVIAYSSSINGLKSLMANYALHFHSQYHSPLLFLYRPHRRATKDDQLVRRLEPVENPHLIPVFDFCRFQIARHDGSPHAVVPFGDDSIDFGLYPGVVIFGSQVVEYQERRRFDPFDNALAVYLRIDQIKERHHGDEIADTPAFNQLPQYRYGHRRLACPDGPYEHQSRTGPDMVVHIRYIVFHDFPLIASIRRYAAFFHVACSSCPEPFINAVRFQF